MATKLGEMTFWHLKRDSKVWTRVWVELAGLQPGQWKGNTECEDEDTGEVWQYMGSYCDDAMDPVGVHEFRHRCHPADGERWYLQIPAKQVKEA